MPSNFNPNVPTGLINLDTDYQNLQNNNQQLDTTYGRNHYKFSDQTVDNGKHKFIEMPINSPLPADTTSQGILYTQSINSDTQLFYRSDSPAFVNQITPALPLICAVNFFWNGAAIVVNGPLAAGTAINTNAVNITRASAGQYTVTFLIPCLNKNYATALETESLSLIAPISGLIFNKTIANVEIVAFNEFNPSLYTDPASVSLMVWGY